MDIVQMTKILDCNVYDSTGRMLVQPALMLLRGRWCWQYHTFWPPCGPVTWKWLIASPSPWMCLILKGRYSKLVFTPTCCLDMKHLKELTSQPSPVSLPSRNVLVWKYWRSVQSDFLVFLSWISHCPITWHWGFSQACKEQHIAVEGHMVYCVLWEGTAECSNTLEDADDSELLPQALVFKPCRKRIYGLLLLNGHGGSSQHLMSHVMSSTLSLLVFTFAVQIVLSKCLTDPCWCCQEAAWTLLL